MQALKILDQTKHSTNRVSGLIGELLAELDAKNVGYCHWKSNWRLERWLAGEGDLDLLIRRSDTAAFIDALARLGFKQAVCVPEKEMPAVVNFYGFDSEMQKFIHVHAHFQLVLGHDLTKNYRLPFETEMLDSRRVESEIFIPSPAMEYLIFVLRMILKNSFAEDAARFFSGKLKKHRKEISDELSFLENRADKTELKLLLSRLLPMIDEDFFNECVDVLRGQPNALKSTIIRLRLEKALSIFARRGFAAERLVRLRNRGKYIFEKISSSKSRRKKRLLSGGALIAMVGGDGAGKTTCVSKISEWLGKSFTVTRFHFGKPPKSFLSIACAGAIRIIDSFRLDKNALVSAEDGRLSLTEFFREIRLICVARDRLRLYKRMRRRAADGELVICDRYPVAGIYLMDNAKINISRRHLKPLAKRLGKIEEWYYRRIKSPDVMLVLRVEPFTAVNRKFDEDRGHVFLRSTELWKKDWQQNRAFLIDANRPLAEVLSELRGLLWTLL